jgi:Na+/H+ antiporter NhaD/arsenite permease-like protein
VAKLVIFQALAVNAGSALTPIGNPQNMFLWQHGGASGLGFVLAMLPVVTMMMAGLVFLTFVAFRPRPLAMDPRSRRAPEGLLLVVSLLLYVPFLVLAGGGRPGLGLLVVFAVFLFASRGALMRVDWPLLAIFALMFIAFRSVADLAFLQATLGGLVRAGPLGLFVGGALLSQFVSNVPAAIVLAEYSADWRTIAWGVNVGGFGTAVASLANIIALRMLGERKAWWTFHLYAVPFLLASGLAVAALMSWMT